MPCSLRLGRFGPPLFVLLILVFARNLAAQGMGTGTITGTVVDPSNATVGGASITAVDLNTRRSQAATTNDQGNYVFANMPIGQYEIAAQHPGFTKVVQQSVRVNADSTTAVNISLRVGASQESITVTAAPPCYSDREWRDRESGKRCTGQ
jgi:hypothetical protein